ncbi:hypothetical protein ACFOQM_06455 [Paenibacillus sp. GCM10012307]|nr:hypothetical protein [Paenibacillus roseus]
MFDVDNRLIICKLLEGLSSSVGREILLKLYIKDQKEAEVARELNISQQAVNRWKNKMLKELSQMLRSAN